MKRTLALVMLAGFLLSGCSSKSAQTATMPSASAAADVASGVTVPNVVGKRLDKAMDELKGLGLKVAATDTVDGKSIMLKSNWQVSSQDVAPGATVAKSSQVNLGVSHLTDATPTPTPSPTPTPKLVPVVEVPAAAAPPAAKVAPPVAVPVPAAPRVAPAAPTAVYYANCAAVKAAGAAPIRAGAPGYRPALDRDKDGIACDK